jgi:Lrp/AsnC family transcriptional regulator, regulator for asnA, asnC and gidA
MERIEKQILDELTKDTRKPFSHIAKKIGVSTQTVINRYNEMKTKGIIKFCSISVDLSKIGYVGTAHLFLKIAPFTIPSQVINEVNKIQDIIIATTSIGDYEGYGVLAFRNTNDLYEKVRKMRKINGIDHMEFSIATPGIPFFPPSRNCKIKNSSIKMDTDINASLKNNQFSKSI